MSLLFYEDDAWWVRCKHNNKVGPFKSCKLALEALRDIYATN
jgi:hypothetical protein